MYFIIRGLIMCVCVCVCVCVRVCVCLCLQTLLLHGSLPEEDQDGTVSFGDSRTNTEPQLVHLAGLSPFTLHRNILFATLCDSSVSDLVKP